MDSSPPDDDPAEAAVWQAMVLFSTLSTATEVWHAARERRAGRDPSAQEEAVVVRPYLRRAAGGHQALVLQLQAGRVQATDADEEGHIAALVRRYHDLMALHRVAQHLKVIHQRLLSLYPAVTEALVEEARLLYGESSALPVDEDAVFLARLGSFLHQALVFTGSLYRAVG